MTQRELLAHIFVLVADEAATPSEPLFNYALEHGWFSSVRHMNCASFFLTHRATEQQLRLVREIQHQIFRGYLRDFLPRDAQTLTNGA